MNTVLDGLIIIDYLGIIHAFNPSAVRIFGYQPNEVLGKNIKMLMPEPYQSAHDSYLTNYLESHTPKVIGIGREVKGRRKNGEIFPMDLGVNEMNVNDMVMFVGTVRDITERKASEASIERYITALKQSNQELDDFAYIASHDLKEPLRGLSNNALFLKEDWGNKLNEDAIKRIDRMIYLAGRMEQLTNDLLYFSRLGKQDLAISEAPLEDIVHDVTSMLDAVIVEGSVEVKIVNPLPTVTCDIIRIREVFRNLITNAIKYNDKPLKKIEIGSMENNTFFVRDNGIGIKECFYHDIFRIFKRLNTEDDATKGTGVGLTFVKKIIDRHHGSIWVQSEMGQGTTFYFTLPQGLKDDRNTTYYAH